MAPLREAHLRLAVEDNGAGNGVEIFPTAPEPEDRPENRSSVRIRLRARLVDRRCCDLVATWQRRHGDLWAERLLCEDFQTHEELHRICEALSLRPDLEVRVVALAKEHAREDSGARLGGAAEYAGAGPGFDCQDLDAKAVESDCSSTRAGSDKLFVASAVGCEEHLAPESDNAWSPTPSQQTTPRQSPAPSPCMAPKSMPRAAEEIFWHFEVGPSCDSTRHARDGDGDFDNAPDRSEAPAAPAKTAGELAHRQEGENAPSQPGPGQLQGVATRATGAAEQRAKPSGCDGAAKAATPRRGSCLKVKFAYKSTVRFLRCPAEGQYERILYTKAFDGPSGHKARRTIARCDSSSSEGSDDDDARGEPEDDEDDWEDTCDDIADLMSQPRGMLMWSSTWA